MAKNTNTVTLKIVTGSTNYDGFKLLDMNRDIDSTQVKDLVDSFKKYGNAALTLTVIESKVFTGKKELYLADGQHSLTACKQANLPFDYKIIKLENETKAKVTAYVATLNNTQKGWSTNNYLLSYCKDNISEYKLFANLKKESGLTITDLLYIFMGDGSRKTMQVFKDGEMKFADVERSTELYTNVLKVKTLLPNKAFVRRSLYKIMCLSGDFKKMRKAIEKAHEFTIFSENEKDFYTQLIKIYQKEFKK